MLETENSKFHEYIKGMISGRSMRILLTYSSILFIPMFAIIVIYSTSIQALLSFQEARTMRSLENTAQIVQLRLEELSNIQSYIQSNPAVNAIINDAHRPKQERRDIYLLKLALESFPSYHLTNQLIEDSYIFFTEVNFTAKLPSGFVHNKQTYDANVKFHGLSYEALNALCKERHVNRLLVSSDDHGTDILLLRSIVGSETLCILKLNQQNLNGMLEANNSIYGGGSYLLDRDHRLLAGSGTTNFSDDELCAFVSEQDDFFGEIEHLGTRYLSYVYPYGGLTYISLVPKANLLGEIASSRNAMIAISVLSSILGTVLVMWLWHRRRETVLKVERTAQSLGILTSYPLSEHQLLETTVSTLSQTMLELREQLFQQRTVLADTVLRKLSLYGYEDREALEAEARGTALNLDAAYYCLVNVDFFSTNDEHLDREKILPYRVMLKQFLSQTIELRHYIFDLDTSRCAILFLFDKPISTALLKHEFLELTRKIEEKDWIPPTFAISESSDQAMQITELHQQTEQIIQYLTCLDSYGVFTSSDLPQTDDLLYFPMDEELNLQRILKSGTHEELLEFWYKLLRENITNRSLRVDMLIELRDRLRQSILRALTNNLSEDEIQILVKTIQQTESIQGMFDCAELAMYALAKTSRSEAIEAFEDMRRRIQDCIDINLGNSNFNLALLADEIGKSEHTLYRDFKTFFNLSFSSYLEQCRISKAFELLRDEIPIKEVATRVGYTSDHSFRRAFKRVMKVPPSEFLDNID